MTGRPDIAALRRHGLPLRGLLCLLVTVAAGIACAQPPPLRVVISQGGGIYQETLDSFRSRLEALSGSPQTLEIVMSGTDAQAGPAADNDTVVAIGARAAESLSGADGTPAAVLNILVPASIQNKLAASTAPGTRPGAIVLDQPVTRQLALVRRLLPDARRVGVLLGPDTSALDDALRETAARLDLKLVSLRLAAAQDPVPAIRTLLNGTDAILAINDPAVLDPTTSKWLLYMAYRKRVPVIGFSEGYTRAGALASLYSTPQQIGRQAAELVVRGGIRAGESLPPAYFSISTNASVARLLGITLPDTEDLVHDLEAEAP